MSIAQMLLPEFDHELASTRKLLVLTPDASASWKPHEKSMTLGRLAKHLAELPSWCMQLHLASFDFSPPGVPFVPPTFTSRDRIVAEFDENAATGRGILAGMSDEDFMKPWTLLMSGRELFTIPRIAVVRTWVLNHIIHHRGQYSVFLRLQNIAIPGMYGPSADEPGM